MPDRAPQREAGRASPDFAAEIRRRLASAAITPEREIEIVEELGQHLEDRYARSRSAGLPDEEAAAEAWRELDGSDAWAMALSRLDPPPPPPPFASGLRMVPRDVQYAARTLLKARTYTIVCTTSLGVGIGTVLAILLLIRAAFGTPPGVDADGLVEPIIEPTGELRAAARGPILDAWSYPDFIDLRDGVRGLEIAGWAFGQSSLRLPGGGGVVPVPAMYVSGNYFTIVGVPLAAGVGFDATTDNAGAAPVVVLAHRLWETRFDSDPAIVGRAIVLDDVPHVVAGVAPRGYQLHFSMDGAPEVQLWAPLSRHPRIREAPDVRVSRGVDWVHLIGRLDPGTNVARADTAVASIMSALATRYPDTNRFKTGAVRPYSSVGARADREIRVVRGMFLAAAGVVLLVVCLNMSGMMLVRAAMREREFAIRLALGASRGRLIQYLLSEALVLALLGGALAALVLFGVPAAVAWWLEISNPDFERLHPDGWLLMQGLLVCFIASAVLGVLPAIRFSRPAVVSALKNAAGGGQRIGRFHRVTVAIQAALAVPFLVVGGVRLDQARVTATADLGFEPDGLYAVSLPQAGTQGAESRGQWLRRVEGSLAQAPGVSSVTFADGLPLDFASRLVRVTREDDATPVPARMTRVAPGYSGTLGIRLLRGRDIGPADAAAAERVVVLSEPLAARLFPGRDALGARVTLAVGDRAPEAFTIVGVTADLVGSQMGNPRLQLFVPLAQSPAPGVLVIARSAATDSAMRKAFEDALASVDADYRLTGLTTGRQLRQESREDLLVQSVMSAGAAAVALFLAALGVYGVVGFTIATRTREIGVRVALGASRLRIVREVLADALTLVVPGIAGGLALGLIWVRRMDPSWYPLGGVEPLIYLAAAALAGGVAALSGLPSARRAAAVQPLEAMRAE